MSKKVTCLNGDEGECLTLIIMAPVVDVAVDIVVVVVVVVAVGTVVDSYPHLDQALVR